MVERFTGKLQQRQRVAYQRKKDLVTQRVAAKAALVVAEAALAAAQRLASDGQKDLAHATHTSALIEQIHKLQLDVAKRR